MLPPHWDLLLTDVENLHVMREKLSRGSWKTVAWWAAVNTEKAQMQEKGQSLRLPVGLASQHSWGSRGRG